MSNCEGCPFKTRCVGTRGPQDSPLVIVGESPGNEELRLGAPFVGPSGAMLEDALARCDFPPDIEPYYINAIQCYPAGKDVKKLAQATAACNKRVRELLQAHPREVVIALGAAASWTLTGDYKLKITSARGSVVQTPYASKGTVLALHPAFLMRRGQGYSVWLKDLQQGALMLRGEELQHWQPPTWEVVSRPSQLAAVVDSALSQPLISGDIETDALHFMDGLILCLGLTTDGRHISIIPEEVIYSEWAKPALKRLLEGGRWNWHNGLFDILWFWRMGIKAKVDEDTLLLSYTLNENGGYHDLDQVANHWIGAPKHKKVLDQYLSKGDSYRVVPKDVLFRYCAYDLSKTHRMFDPLRATVAEDPHCEKLYTQTLIPSVDLLARMRINGIGVNTDVINANLDSLAAKIAAEEDIIQRYAVEAAGAPILVSSPKQLSNLLYRDLQLKVPNAPSTDESALIEIQRRYDHPIVNNLLRFREYGKWRSTYVAPLAGHIKSDGRIHADFKLHGTQTGRLAGADPNLFNQPRTDFIRRQYGEQHEIIIEIDLNQAELRSLAIMSGDPTLVEIYTKNTTSIHNLTTARFYAPEEEILLGGAVFERCREMLHLQGDVTPKFVWSEAKMRGKAVNFGIVYGREAYSLAKEFDMPIKEAHRLIRAWLDTYPVARDFIEWCRRAPAENRTLITVFGRKKRVGVTTKQNLKRLQNEFANFPHQSTASDIMLEVARTAAPIAEARWGAKVWNSVYDSVYFRMPPSVEAAHELIEYVVALCAEVPRRHGLLRVPFIGEAKIGWTWGDMVNWEGFIPEKPKDSLLI